MKKILVLIVLLLMITPAYADTVYPANARYVIVNPNTMAKTTFLLDTKTGKVWQLVENSIGDCSWQQMHYDWYKQDGTYGGSTLKAPVLISP